MKSFPTQEKENNSDHILSYFASTPDERQRLDVEIARRKESLRRGAFLCEKINALLAEKNGLKFKTNIDRLYFDETFSFETFKYPNQENEDKLDVLIRIKPRGAQANDDVQPSLLSAVAIIEVGDNSKELKLDALGEARLEGVEPEIFCRFTNLKAASEKITENIGEDTVISISRTDSQSYIPRWSTLLIVLSPVLLVLIFLSPYLNLLPSETRVNIRGFNQVDKAEANKDEDEKAKAEDSMIVYFSPHGYNDVTEKLELLSAVSNICRVQEDRNETEKRLEDLLTLFESLMEEMRLVKDERFVELSAATRSIVKRICLEEEKYLADTRSFVELIRTDRDFAERAVSIAKEEGFDKETIEIYIKTSALVERAYSMAEDRLTKEEALAALFATSKRLAENEQIEDEKRLDEFFEGMKQLIEKARVAEWERIEEKERLSEILENMEGLAAEIGITNDPRFETLFLKVKSLKSLTAVNPSHKEETFRRAFSNDQDAP